MELLYIKIHLFRISLICFLRFASCPFLSSAQEKHYAKNKRSIDVSEVIGLQLYSGTMVNFDFKYISSYTKGVSIVMKDQQSLSLFKPFSTAYNRTGSNR